MSACRLVPQCDFETNNCGEPQIPSGRMDDLIEEPWRERRPAVFGLSLAQITGGRLDTPDSVINPVHRQLLDLLGLPDKTELAAIPLNQLTALKETTTRIHVDVQKANKRPPLVGSMDIKRLTKKEIGRLFTANLRSPDGDKPEPHVFFLFSEPEGDCTSRTGHFVISH